MTQTEALKMALDEIKRVKEICLREIGIGLCNEVVIAKLEEALAQPELTFDGLTPTEFALRELHESREAAVRAERQRIVNLLMMQHEAAKGSHNYWHVAANLIKAESGENV